MAVKIRMQRGGATHHPHYRVVVTDVRSPRDGRFVERVGTYDPKNKDAQAQVNLKLDRIDYWLGVGAQPSDTVRSLIKRARREAPAEAAVVETAAAGEGSPEAATE
ncbi:MAG TPA: 30S ribosomal protein S16 [Oceanipulchritudo sp.]|nr:30S ribosomal protein S16 [Oceanipulchritudo sp.]